MLKVIIGFVCGIIFSLIVHQQLAKQYIEIGMIRLVGKYYELNECKEENGYENR